MNPLKLNGLVAATYTPLRKDGSLNLSQVGPMVEHLIDNQIRGIYVCGSTGEGMSLSTHERQQLAAEFVQAVAGRVPVIIQVGHNSLAEAKQLASHAQQISADAVSATCPSYFKINQVESLIESVAEIASGSPDLPFYYYHIPVLTGSKIDMVEFLQRGSERIPNLTGLKFTDTALHEFQQCLELDSGRFDVVWGCDEMLLGALATGTTAAIGSTYNIAAPLYHQVIDAFSQGNLIEARRLQSVAIKMIRTISAYPFHSAMKEILGMLAFDFGPCRLPQPKLSSQEVATLRQELESIGFFEWSVGAMGSPIA